MDRIGNFQLPRFSSCEIRPPTHQKFVLDDLDRMGSQGREIMSKDVPQNVPRQYANQAAYARHALHARTFFLSDFLSIENKECLK